MILNGIIRKSRLTLYIIKFHPNFMLIPNVWATLSICYMKIISPKQYNEFAYLVILHGVNLLSIFLLPPRPFKGPPLISNICTPLLHSFWNRSPYSLINWYHLRSFKTKTCLMLWLYDIRLENILKYTTIKYIVCTTHTQAI